MRFRRWIDFRGLSRKSGNAESAMFIQTPPNALPRLCTFFGVPISSILIVNAHKNMVMRPTQMRTQCVHILIHQIKLSHHLKIANSKTLII